MNKMRTLTTQGIKVSVEPFFQPFQSRPRAHKYVFSYQITIENLSDVTVQLLRRHWFILDSSGLLREIEGEGVIGKQPILKPGYRHQYSSWCPLMTDTGKMWGFFVMLDKTTNETFEVMVPEFLFIAPFKNN